MRIETILVKSLTFEELLTLKPNRPTYVSEAHGHLDSMRDIIELIVNEYEGDVAAFGRATRTFDDRQISLISDWDYAKVEPLYLYNTREGCRVRDGFHRTVILGVSVLTGQFEYQPIEALLWEYDRNEVSDFATYIEQWISRFYADPTHKSHLDVELSPDELHDESFAKTLEAYKKIAKGILNQHESHIAKRVLPFTVRVGCGYDLDDQSIRMSGQIVITE